MDFESLSKKAEAFFVVSWVLSCQVEMLEVCGYEGYNCFVGVLEFFEGGLMRKGRNHYEIAFQAWLNENHINFLEVDQSRRAFLARSKVKSFDCLIYTPAERIMIAEVKGRLFKGTSLEGMKSMPNWVTLEDIRGLIRWEDVLGDEYKAYFVFAYCLEKVYVDSDGQELFFCDGKSYVFYCVSIDDYQGFMRLRSRKWQTVNLSSADFRCCAKPAHILLS